MGYRSDVAIALRREDMVDLLKRAEALDRDAFGILLRGEHIMSDSGRYVVWHQRWIKWYEDYEAIRFIMSIVRGYDCYAFKRIGEDFDDIETENGYSDDNADGFVLDELIDINRSFDISGDMVNANWLMEVSK